eukprot:7999047-Prorocentrum_lima.AAC.1
MEYRLAVANSAVVGLNATNVAAVVESSRIADNGPTSWSGSGTVEYDGASSTTKFELPPCRCGQRT